MSSTAGRTLAMAWCAAHCMPAKRLKARGAGSPRRAVQGADTHLVWPGPKRLTRRAALSTASSKSLARYMASTGHYRQGRAGP